MKDAQADFLMSKIIAEQGTSREEEFLVMNLAQTVTLWPDFLHKCQKFLWGLHVPFPLPPVISDLMIDSIIDCISETDVD